MPVAVMAPASNRDSCYSYYRCRDVSRVRRIWAVRLHLIPDAWLLPNEKILTRVRFESWRGPFVDVNGDDDAGVIACRGTRGASQRNTSRLVQRYLLIPFPWARITWALSLGSSGLYFTPGNHRTVMRDVLDGLRGQWREE